MPHLVLDADGHPVAANAACRAMFGGQPPEVPADALRRALAGETVRTVDDARRLASTFFPLCRDDGRVTHVAVAYQELRESETRYRTFLGLSSEGIWRFEALEPVDVTLPPEEQVRLMFERGVLAECNDAYARMYGHERAEELIGRRLDELLVPDDPRNIAYLTDFVRAGYRLVDAESHEVDRYGNPLVLLNSLVGVIEDGQLVRAWGTQRDVTAQHAAREQLEAASRAKDQFLAMLGHELRNPLSPMLTALQLMKLRGGDAFSKEREILERQVRHLVRLVDDLLDVSRMTRGQITLELRPVDVREAVANAIEQASPLLEARVHHLDVEVPEGLVVRGDPTRLAQVFANLLTNAAKYTPPGGRITIDAAEDGDRARVRICDTGIGIRPEILPGIFSPFVQETQALDRSQGGLGLGLAIVRSLVELHHGEVQAHSEGVGRGSTFTVWLPRIASEATVEAPTEPAVAPTPGKQVLVVDDNADAAELLRDVLVEGGHTVRVAHDGPSALATLEGFSPDAALLDIGLPVMDGYELARRIHARPELADIPLIAVTGYGQARDFEASRAAGFEAHLVKPIDLEALEAELARVLRP